MVKVKLFPAECRIVEDKNPPEMFRDKPFRIESDDPENQFFGWYETESDAFESFAHHCASFERE